MKNKIILMLFMPLLFSCTERFRFDVSQDAVVVMKEGDLELSIAAGTFASDSDFILSGVPFSGKGSDEGSMKYKLTMNRLDQEKGVSLKFKLNKNLSSDDEAWIGLYDEESGRWGQEGVDILIGKPAGSETSADIIESGIYQLRISPSMKKRLTASWGMKNVSDGSVYSEHISFMEDGFYLFENSQDDVQMTEITGTWEVDFMKTDEGPFSWFLILTPEGQGEDGKKRFMSILNDNDMSLVLLRESDGLMTRYVRL